MARPFLVEALEPLPERLSESLLSFEAASLEVLWNNTFCMSWCTTTVSEGLVSFTKSSKCDRISAEVFRFVKKRKRWLDGFHFPLSEGSVDQASAWNNPALRRMLPQWLKRDRLMTLSLRTTRLLGLLRPTLGDLWERTLSVKKSSQSHKCKHGNDVSSRDRRDVVAAICKRVSARLATSQPENLIACTIDLRKVCKELPVSEKSLNDCFLCVHDPRTSSPAFSGPVLRLMVFADAL